MVEIIIAVLLGLASPSTHTHTIVNPDGSTYTYSCDYSEDGTGGDNGHIPPRIPGVN